METNFRKLTIKDLPYRMKWLNDQEVNKYLGHRVREGTDEEFHRRWFESYFNDEFREIFTIEVDGKPVGQVGLLDINLLDKNSCLYIIIGEKDYWGKGVGSQAMEFILDYGFNKLKLHKIWLEVYARNSVAKKLYKKFGFHNEGIFKDQVLYPDGFSDEIRMARFHNSRPKKMSQDKILSKLIPGKLLLSIDLDNTLVNRDKSANFVKEESLDSKAKRARQ